MMKSSPLRKRKKSEFRTTRPMLLRTAFGFVFLAGTILGATAQIAPPENRNNENPENKLTVGTYSGEQLRRCHPLNLIKALQMADPSITVDLGEEAIGSDPNDVPMIISIGGIRNFTTYRSGRDNPLLIADGHEISIERFADFDIARVESVSVLKDPAQTAMYGIRGGNGVIVIKTVKPEQGTLRLNYRFDGGVDFADLSSYNIMNSASKLALEKELGIYAGKEALYNQRAANKGTDWLKLPLTTPFRHRHHVDIEGGDNTLAMKFSLMAEPAGKGIMKGSSRERYGAGGRLDYYSDRLQVTEEFRAELVFGAHSPFGSFIDYTLVNPYYSPWDAKGQAIDILGEGTLNPQYSPYFESTLSSFSKQKTTRISNNLGAAYKFTDNLHLKGSFSFTKDLNKYDQYISPRSTKFYGLDEEYDLVGTYNIRRDNLTAYEGHLDLFYTYTQNRHALNAAFGVHSYSSVIYADNYTGMGMPIDQMGYISFAKRYDYRQRPGGREYEDHLLGAYVQGNYEFDKRYGAAFTARFDKSSQLAPEKRTAPTWAIDGSWKIHNEQWMQGSAFDYLVLSAGVGGSSAFQFDYSMVNPTYYYAINDPYLNSPGTKAADAFGLVSLMQASLSFNSKLKWRTDTNIHGGLSLSLWNRVQADLRYYNVTSSDLAVQEAGDITLGTKNSWVNDGKIRNSGFEFSVKVDVLKNKDFGLSVLANGFINKNEIVRIPDFYAAEFNEQYRYSGLQLVEGHAVNGVHAAPSAGIDPNTGKEIFRTLSGGTTGSWYDAGLIYYGDPAPKIKGSFGLMAKYKQWDFNCLMRYSVGANYYDAYSAYYIDAANINGNGSVNMNEKWQKTGQQTAWQSFDNTNTYPTSRFVSKRNTLSLSSVGVGYNLDAAKAAKIAMKGLYIGVICNDLFFLSSVDTPRGLLYPYARSFTLTLKATF